MFNWLLVYVTVVKRFETIALFLVTFYFYKKLRYLNQHLKNDNEKKNVVITSDGHYRIIITKLFDSHSIII